MTPLAIALPSQQGSVAQAQAGLNQRAWPASPNATVWGAYPLAALLERTWDCDAHAFAYTVAGDPWGWGAGRWPRLGVDALGPEARAVGDAAWLTSAWLDFDRVEHAPWAFGDDRVGALAALRRAFPAAWVYDTTSGARVVHVLAEPVPLRWARWWLRGWVREAGLRATAAGVADRGLVLDTTCGEWTRCFRLPYVVRGCEAVLGADGALGWSGGAPTAPIALQPPDGARLDWWPDGAPDIEDRTAASHGAAGATPTSFAPPDGWLAWVKPSGALPAEMLQALATGAPFGPPTVAAGGRNPALKRVLNSLATQLSRRDGYEAGVPPGALYGIVGPSVAAEAARDAGAPTLADAWRLAQGAASASVDRAAVLAAPSMPSSPPTADTEGETVPAIVHCETDTDKAYVWDPAEAAYIGPLRGTGLRAALARCVPDVPLIEGRGQLRDLGKVLHAHAVAASEAIESYPGAEGGPAWDASTRVLRVRTFRPPRVEPQHDDAVAEWLEELLGADLDLGLDWLATVTRLDRPTSALYLQGPPSAGKGMLAASVARLWRTAPVAWREAVGQFNAGLLRSPVVFLDEGTRVGRADSGRFRSLTGERQHAVERKHHTPTVLRGCPRVMIAANGPGAIALQEGHAADELQAIGQRILHVDVGVGAVRYLAELGGAEATTDWVSQLDGSPGRVPRYIAHLAATRRVALGDRYLVAGAPGLYHLRLVTDDPLYAQVLLAIASALAPESGVGGGPGVWAAPLGAPGDYRPGRAWVNPRALHSRWKGLVVEDGHRPVVQSVARACKALADGPAVTWSVAGRASDYWSIPVALIERVAHDTGHTDAHRIGEAVTRGLGGPQGAPWLADAHGAVGAVVPFTRGGQP